MTYGGGGGNNTQYGDPSSSIMGPLAASYLGTSSSAAAEAHRDMVRTHLNSSLFPSGGASSTMRQQNAVAQPPPVPLPGHKPLHERAEELARRKAEALAKARLQAATSNPELTFKPRINPVSAKLAAKKQQEQTKQELEAQQQQQQQQAHGGGGGPLSGIELPEMDCHGSNNYLAEAGSQAYGVASAPTSVLGISGLPPPPQVAPAVTAALRLAKQAEEAAARRAARQEAAARAEESK